MAGKHDEPLYGTHALESLARIIHDTMPEENPAKCVDEDAAAVAAYIHGAFYSPEARARRHPPRVALARLTNRQYRESVADLVGSFQPAKPVTRTGGLQAEYFQSKGMNKKEKKAFARQDSGVDFDFGDAAPGEGIEADQFSIAWQGSLFAPDTGEYEFRLQTPNGARLYLNQELREGDANRRDDSDARRQEPFIDLWVSSGGQLRAGTGSLNLLGGRRYPLRLDYFKYKETNASIRLEWRPPHGVWSAIPSELLSPQTAVPVLVIGTPFPPDDASHGYERGTAVSKAWHEASMKAALETAGAVLARLPALSGVHRDAADRGERLREFAATFTARAFRRPLSADEKVRYVDRAFTAAPDAEQAVKRVVLLALQSPQFLYPDLAGSTDAYSVAARLALGMWDSVPDAALLEAAGRGELETPDEIRSQARRMADDPRTWTKLREFLHEWLAFDEAGEIAKDPEAYPGFDAAVVADLRTSLDRFLDHVVRSDTSDYRELFQADYLFVNARLASFYGWPATHGDGFVRVSLDPVERAGVLTHPFLLATFSYYKSTSPIHRGVFLTRHLLGRFLKPPPMAIQFMDDRFDPSMTMREKVTELTKADSCMTCHAIINPLGFSLEHFDAVGRRRSQDNGKPVDAESDYLTTAGEVMRLGGPQDLARHIVSSEEARLGFVRQMFHHAVKQPPMAYGPDTLRQLADNFARSNYHIRDLFLAVNTVAAGHRPQPPLQASR